MESDSKMQQEGGCPTGREKLGAKTDPSAYQPHVKLNCVPSDLLLSSCTLAGAQFLSVAIQQLHPHLFPPQTVHFLSVCPYVSSVPIYTAVVQTSTCT